MESIIFMAELSFVVSLLAAIREGIRRKSDGMIAAAMLLLIPAGISLLSEIMVDRRLRNMESQYSQTTEEDRRMAMAYFESMTRRDPDESSTFGCFWMPELSPADATSPENGVTSIGR